MQKNHNNFVVWKISNPKKLLAKIDKNFNKVF